MLVLASNSPRRKQLLALAGWEFCVKPAHVDEGVRPGELPGAYVRRLAESKARQSALESGAPGDVIVAADTAVVVSAAPGATSYDILGKPRDAAEAEAMLRRLRGRVHWVYSGLAVLRVVDGSMYSDVCITEVPMRTYSDEEMLAYIASGDPMDKAGAYAIQHAGFRPVESLQGCYANVVGLPLCHLAPLLATFEMYPENQVVQKCQAALGYRCEIQWRE